MQNLSGLLKNNPLQKRMELQAKPLDDQTIFFVFRQVVIREFGARGGANIAARYLKDGKLFVAVKSSIWAQELTFERENFRQLLNQELGQEAILEIKVENAFG